MANHVSALRNIVAGIEVRTTHLYGQYLSFDKLAAIISDALNSVEPDTEGSLIYRYKSKVRTTTPYRTLFIEQTRYVPDRWFVVKDTGHNSFTGLEVFRFVNIHRLPEPETFHNDKRTGMIFQVLPPKGWGK